jgi:hypothetical protein
VKGCYPISLDYFQDSLYTSVAVLSQGAATTIRRILPDSVLFCDSSGTPVLEPVADTRAMVPSVRVFRGTDGVVMVYVPYGGDCVLRIVSLDGKSVATVHSDKPAAYGFSRKQLAPGAYLLRVESDSHVQSRVIVLDR